MSVTLLVLATLATATFVGFAWLRSQPSREEQLYFFRCRCGQKVRYRASRAGKSALCPRCKEVCKLPLATDDLLQRIEQQRPTARFGRLTTDEVRVQRISA